jgi:hypothetical protein
MPLSPVAYLEETYAVDTRTKSTRDPAIKNNKKLLGVREAGFSGLFYLTSVMVIWFKGRSQYLKNIIVWECKNQLTDLRFLSKVYLLTIYIKTFTLCYMLMCVDGLMKLKITRCGCKG